MHIKANLGAGGNFRKIEQSLKQTPPLCVCAVLHIWLNPGLYPRLMLYMSLKLLYKVLYA